MRTFQFFGMSRFLISKLLETLDSLSKLPQYNQKKSTSRCQQQPNQQSEPERVEREAAAKSQARNPSQNPQRQDSNSQSAEWVASSRRANMPPVSEQAHLFTWPPSLSTSPLRSSSLLETQHATTRRPASSHVTFNLPSATTRS